MRTVFLATRTFIIAIGNENGPDIIDTALVFFFNKHQVYIKTSPFPPWRVKGMKTHVHTKGCA